MGKTNLYTIVTNDEYELPVLCDIRVAAAAEFFGCAENDVRKMVLRPLKKLKYKPIVTGTVRHDAQASRIRYELTHDRAAYYRRYYRENRKKWHERYEKRKGMAI